MMKMLVYILVVLSLVVLSAHFMRYGNTVGMTASLIPVALLFLRRPWSARLIQVVLVLGALEWLYTIYGLVQVRAAMDQPYTRMVVILGVVAAITFCSALLFQLPIMKRIYGLLR